MEEQNPPGGPPPLPPVRTSIPPQYPAAAPPVLLQEEPETDEEREILAGARYLIFEYCISIVVLSFKRHSGIIFLKPGQSGFGEGVPYSLISFFAGWWGIPWGPIWTISSLATNLGGGKDVTQEVLAAKMGPGRATALLGRRRSAPTAASKKAFPVWGWAVLILFIVAAVAFGVYGFTLVLRNASDHSAYRSSPGRAEFEAANKTIDFNHGTIAFGNSSQAVAIANSFSKQMKQFREVQFEGGKKNGYSASEHEFMTYCDLQTNQCILLVHVPELRRYTSDAKTAMSVLAWETAQRVLRETQAGQAGQKLIVGVRGAIFYERVMTGNYVQNLSEESKGMLSSKEGFDSREQLYSAFHEASADRALPITEEKP